jgi:hypothetical protein
MGKQKASNKKDAPSAPKCTCDHPFNCSCGNRPPRPSRGHKWDPETQEWGGKGHKQKGASGQTASIGQQAQTTEVGKTQIAQWQKLPSSILREYCEKQKRPPPKFKQVMNDPNSDPPRFKVRVIVPDPKRDQDKDLILVPAVPVANEEQATEEAALLALLQLTPNLPHERKFPEPYKTTWLNAISAQQAASSKKSAGKAKVAEEVGLKGTFSAGNNPGSAGTAASSNNQLALGTAFASRAERRQQIEEEKKARNARIRKHEAARWANRDHPVFLSARLRTQIQQLLRGDVILVEDGEDEDENTTDALDRFDSDLQASVEGRLHQEGFTRRQVRTAFEQRGAAHVDSADGDEREWDQVYENCLQWLCVHLEEDQLPEGFDPRGQTLELVTPLNTTSKTKLVASRFGISLQDAKWMVQQQGKGESGELSLEDVFWNRLCEIAGVSLRSTVGIENEPALNVELVDDELEAIKSMFLSDFEVTTSSDGKYSTLIINTPESFILNIKIQRGKYPAVYPELVLFLGKWDQPASVAFHVEMVKFMSTLSLGEGMLFEIYGQAQNLFQCLEELPNLALAPTANSVARIDLPGPLHTPISQPSSAKQHSIKQTVGHKRSRVRSPFWSDPPSRTPPSTPFCWSPSIERQRKSLPAWKARDDFLSKLNEASKSSRVVLVTGDTGCGKTTQIPQFILEDNPDSCKIVIAQPRRLAATGVAARVAEERGEKQPGEASVGYVVRGATAVSRNTRLLFCTFGVLLRQLQSDGALDAVTHVVIDEVHERNLDGDVLMGLLRESLKTVPHLNVILMSATLDADRFAAYWGNAPTMHIPGRAFPVEDFMLEDVLLKTNYIPPKKRKKHGGYRVNRSNGWANKMSDDPEKSENDVPDGEEENEDEKDNEQNSTTTNEGDGTVTNLLSLEERLKRVDQDSVDYDLLGLLIKSIVQSKEMGTDGSILVFLQGAGEISQAKTVISKITRGMPILLLPLHGGLQPKDQVLVFRRTPNQVKVILSTNVAETSITIPDCTVVIDSCREKQSSFDPVNRMPMLLDCFASKASLKQRRGRAGRVKSGKCYKLISTARYATLSEHTAPEITRCALDQTLLSLLFLGAEDGTGKFLKKLLDPPSLTSVNNAASSLLKLGALEKQGQNGLLLTPLGMHLAGIPAPPTVGKLLVMGAILGCRTGALVSIDRFPLFSRFCRRLT